MNEKPELPVDVHSDEFRNHLYNHMLEMIEHAARVGKVADLVEGVSFQDLTPQRWVQIASYVDSLRAIHDHNMKTLGAAGDLMENKKTVQVIGEFTADQINKGNEGR